MTLPSTFELGSCRGLQRYDARVCEVPSLHYTNMLQLQLINFATVLTTIFVTLALSFAAAAFTRRD